MEVKQNVALDAYGDENYSEESVISALNVITEKNVLDDGSNKDSFFELLFDNRFPTLIVSCGEHNYQKCGEFAMDQGPYNSVEVTDVEDIKKLVSELRTWCDNTEKVIENKFN